MHKSEIPSSLNLNDLNFLTISDVSNQFSVSKATVRNWVKTGKLTPKSIHNKKLFLEQDVINLKNEVEAGQTNFLKSRRNKTSIKGKHVPENYVSCGLYSQLVELIIEHSKNLKIELILHEVALKLFVEVKKLAYPRDYRASLKSLTELSIEGVLDLGIYKEVFAEMYCCNKLQEDEKTTLREFNELHIPIVEGEDFLGLLYTALSCLGDRKIRGSYYTPHDVVTYMVSKALSCGLNERSLPLKAKSIRILDPCCGSGNFLIHLFLQLKDLFEKMGLSPKSAEDKAISSIYGFDIDAKAVTIAKLNILLLTRFYTDSKLNVIHTNTLELDNNTIGNSFDMILGNPPWGYYFTEFESKYYREKYNFKRGSLESFSLFVKAGLKLLRDGGLLAYVLPESILSVNIHQYIRKDILNNSLIKEIKLLGQKFSKVYAPAAILITEKVNRVIDFNVEDNMVNIILPEDSFIISQCHFLQNDNYVFNVNADLSSRILLEKIRSLPNTMYLKNNADFALGIVTGNNKTFLSPARKNNAEIILKGKDIYKYNYFPSSNYIVFEPTKLQQVAPIQLYRAPEKIFYRFINDSLVFSYDDRQILSINSANILIPKLKGYSLKYVLAVLNSRPVQFFYSLSFSSIKILRKYIEEIPIPTCDDKIQSIIVELVDTLIKTSNLKERQNIYDQIDSYIMDLYKLNATERKLIRTKFNTVKYLSK